MRWCCTQKEARKDQKAATVEAKRRAREAAEMTHRAVYAWPCWTLQWRILTSNLSCAHSMLQSLLLQWPGPVQCTPVLCTPCTVSPTGPGGSQGASGGQQWRSRRCTRSAGFQISSFSDILRQKIHAAPSESGCIAGGGVPMGRGGSQGASGGQQWRSRHRCRQTCRPTASASAWSSCARKSWPCWLRGTRLTKARPARRDQPAVSAPSNADADTCLLSGT